MTTAAQPLPSIQRSRLEPEPMARRDFLGLAAMWSAAAALLFAFMGILRLPKAAVLPSPSKRFRVALPESLPAHAPFLPPGRSVALFRADRGVYAVSTVCTHLGCIVKATPVGFDCPCHGSKFAKDGSVVRGPAPKALPRLSVARLGENEYLVDEGKILSPGTEEYA